MGCSLEAETKKGSFSSDEPRKCGDRSSLRLHQAGVSSLTRLCKRLAGYGADASPYMPSSASFFRLSGTGHGRNFSFSPWMYLMAAFAATRPKTTQSSKELPH